MKISELLLENTDKKRHKNTASDLSSAASIDDEPQDEFDDREDDELDNSDDQTREELIETLRQDGGSMGSDLYSITVFTSKDNFLGAYVSSADAVNPLEELVDDQIAQEYINQGDSEVSNRKIISCLILNSRNGELFRFDSGEDINEFRPSISELVSSQTIDNDQVTRLKSVLQAGKMYSNSIRNVQWRAGEEPNTSSSRAERIYDSLDALKRSLNLKEPREISYSSVKISPEQAKRNKEYHDKSMKAWDEYINSKIAANPAGRKKR